MAEYAHPEVLVETDWVADHLNDSNVRLVESNEDILLYDQGHIPGAVKLDWVADLNDPVVRDYLDRERFEKLLAAKGISNDTTVIFYGDKNNWWATYAFWVFKLFGHQDARIMNGGRAKWIAEGRELTREVPSYPEASYQAQERDDQTIRAFRDQVREHLDRRSTAASAPICRSTRRRARCAAGTSPPLSASRGPRRFARTAPSRAQRSCASCTRARACRRTRT
jgi:thiosulfate/3-mercaptopyruvate sulfurtransferase